MYFRFCPSPNELTNTHVDFTISPFGNPLTKQTNYKTNSTQKDTPTIQTYRIPTIICNSQEDQVQHIMKSKHKSPSFCA